MIALPTMGHELITEIQQRLKLSTTNLSMVYHGPFICFCNFEYLSWFDFIQVLENFLSYFWFKHIIRQFTIPHPHIKLRTREFKARIMLNPNIRGSNIKIKDSKQNSIQLLSSNNLILTWTAQFLNFKEGTTVPDSF